MTLPFVYVELVVHYFTLVMSVSLVTQGLIKGINMLDERYGNVYVHFCEPMSAHRYVWQMSGGDISYTSRALQREQYQITHLAHTIVDRCVLPSLDVKKHSFLTHLFFHTSNFF
jgi:hypothetical protein